MPRAKRAPTRKKPASPARPPFDYAGEFERLMILVNAAATMSIDIDGLTHHHGRAQILGPMFEPTTYMRGGAQNLEHQAEVLRIAVPFIRKARELRAQAGR